MFFNRVIIHSERSGERSASPRAYVYCDVSLCGSVGCPSRRMPVQFSEEGFFASLPSNPTSDQLLEVVRGESRTTNGGQ